MIFDQKGGLSSSAISALITADSDFKTSESDVAIGTSITTAVTITLPNNSGKSLIIIVSNVTAPNFGGGTTFLKLFDNGVDSKDFNFFSSLANESHTHVMFYIANNNGQNIALQVNNNGAGGSPTSHFEMLAIQKNS